MPWSFASGLLNWCANSLFDAPDSGSIRFAGQYHSSRLTYETGHHALVVPEEEKALARCSWSC
jgi:hypothetical protein